MEGNPIPLRPQAPDCQVPCGLPEEAAARAAADSRIEAKLDAIAAQLAETSRVLLGARTAVRALLALALGALAQWAPEGLSTVLNLLTD